jgi:hypothetical protein
MERGKERQSKFVKRGPVWFLVIHVVQRLPGAPTVINAAACGVQGVPSDYQPYRAPINNTPGTANFGNNNVTMCATPPGIDQFFKKDKTDSAGYRDLRISSTRMAVNASTNGLPPVSRFSRVM